MALFDTHANFASGKVTAAPSPSTTGTTFSISNADAANFPDPQGTGNQAYNAVIWAANQNPLASNSEVVRITAKGAANSGGAGFTQFTITRLVEQNSPSTMTARSIQVGDWIAANITSKLFTDLETALNTKLTAASNLSDVANKVTSRTNLLAQDKVFYTVGMNAADDYVCDGTADDIQIQQALDACNTAGGGIVHIKSGTYDITALLTYYSNMVVEGDGWSTKLKLHSGSNLATILGGNTRSNVVIRNLELDGNKSTMTGPQNCSLISASGGISITAENIYAHDSIQQGIYWGGVTKCVIRNCYAYNNGGVTLPNGRLEGFGFGLNESGVTPSTNNQIINCRAEANYEGGFSIFSGGTYISSSNEIIGCTAINMPSTPAVGFNIYGTNYAPYNNIISNCVSNNVYNGIQVSGYCHNNQVVNCNIQNAANTGIYVQNGVKRSSITGNVVRDCGGIGLNIGSCRYMSVTNNTFTESTLAGINLSQTDHSIVNNNYCYRNGGDGITILNSDNCIISANECVSNSTTTIGNNYGIQLKTSGGGSIRNIVCSNWCTDDQATYSSSNLTSSASSGQAVVLVAVTNLYWEGQQVTLTEGATTEVLTILTIDSTTQITMTTNLVNSYTTAASLKGRTHQRYGIFESDSTSDLNLIYGNICRNNANGSIVTNGVNTVVSHNITS